MKIELPKWNPASRFPSPLITYDTNLLECSGILNTKEDITCTVERGFTSDFITLQQPFKPAATTNEEGEEETPTSIQEGSQISFKVGPIANPLSGAPMAGFKLTTLSSQLGLIADG